MHILKNIIMLAILYIIAVIATFIGEITYKGRSVSEAVADWKRILARCSILLGIMCIATIIYTVLGIRFE
jgi:urease gamma subunit